MTDTPPYLSDPVLVPLLERIRAGIEATGQVVAVLLERHAGPAAGPDSTWTATPARDLMVGDEIVTPDGWPENAETMTVADFPVRQPDGDAVRLDVLLATDPPEQRTITISGDALLTMRRPMPSDVQPERDDPETPEDDGADASPPPLSDPPAHVAPADDAKTGVPGSRAVEPDPGLRQAIRRALSSWSSEWAYGPVVDRVAAAAATWMAEQEPADVGLADAFRVLELCRGLLLSALPDHQADHVGDAFIEPHPSMPGGWSYMDGRGQEPLVDVRPDLTEVLGRLVSGDLGDLARELTAGARKP